MLELLFMDINRLVGLVEEVNLGKYRCMYVYIHVSVEIVLNQTSMKQRQLVVESLAQW